MSILRKILFYVFLGIYLVLCPLVVLYSLGYIYAPKAEERLVKTGLIRLETLPSGASFFLNNRLYAEKTPCTISELLPGRYHVRVQLDGHRPWARSIDVEPGKAAVFDKILLLPKKLRSAVVIPQTFQNMVRVAATRFLLLFGNEKMGSVVVFDWKNGAFRQLLPENSPYTEKEVRRYFLSKGSPFVLFAVQDGGKVRYLWCGLRENDLEVFDISDLFRRGEPDDVRWENGNPEYLFAFYGGRLARLGLDKKMVVPDFMEKLRGYGICRGKVYGLKGTTLVRSNFNAQRGDETTIDGGRFLSGIFHEEGAFRLEFLSPDRVFFIGEKGKLIANLLPYRFIEQGLAGYLPDPSLKKVLVWTQSELGIFDLEKMARAEALFERGPEIDWFWGKGKDIKQAYFVHGVSHALFCDENRIRMTEVGPRSAGAQEIGGVREGTVPFYSEKTGKLYYLEPKEGYLMSLEILPEEKILERMADGIERQKPREGAK